jgi:hypothetical protein
MVANWNKLEQSWCALVTNWHKLRAERETRLRKTRDRFPVRRFRDESRPSNPIEILT